MNGNFPNGLFNDMMNQMNQGNPNQAKSAGNQTNVPSGCPNQAPFTNVVNKYYYQNVPYPVNYHTHVINNCVKCYQPVPQYTCSEETVYIDQCPFANQNNR